MEYFNLALAFLPLSILIFNGLFDVVVFPPWAILHTRDALKQSKLRNRWVALSIITWPVAFIVHMVFWPYTRRLMHKLATLSFALWLALPFTLPMANNGMLHYIDAQIAQFDSLQDLKDEKLTQSQQISLTESMKDLRVILAEVHQNYQRTQYFWGQLPKGMNDMFNGVKALSKRDPIDEAAYTTWMEQYRLFKLLQQSHEEQSSRFFEQLTEPKPIEKSDADSFDMID